MSIPHPTLDDRSYADLLEEARALIPSLAPKWTNHNPSDPGITLVELFAWLTEMLIYRVNRLPEENTLAFLRLLNGPQWTPGESLDDDIRATVLDLRDRHRAVTAEDYEELAGKVPGVKRARCVPKRNLAMKSEEDRRVFREGYVSVVVVPDTSLSDAVDPGSWPGAPLPSADLLAAVRDALEPRRLVTVRQFVVPPFYVPIQAEIVVATRPGVPAAPLRGRVVEAIETYLDALTGGPEGEGWPFGRDVYVSELYRLLEKEVPGVDYVPDIALSSTCPDGAPRCIAGGGLWNEQGDQVGIELTAHHLPWAQIDPTKIVIGSSFLPVRVEVQATAAADVEPAAARRAVKSAVRLLFHRLHGGPGGGDPWEIDADEIEAALLDLPEIAGGVAAIAIEADPARLFEDGSTTGVRFEEGELADVTVTVEA
ncbi:MAG TPA: baseplate J/gp47 family protein [Thermoanaerobaculia bacterium]|nr:baseplate J/gp47 family protein [Thermoanaerobaculia bacterium]